MVATIFKDLTREAGFFPIEEMKRIGIFDYSETTEYLNNPYNALPSETFSELFLIKLMSPHIVLPIKTSFLNLIIKES